MAVAATAFGMLAVDRRVLSASAPHKQASTEAAKRELPSGVTEDQVLRYFVTPDLLVIDEVGVQFGTATEQLYLTEVINDRYEAMKPMILLSNLTLKQVEDTLGVRSMERFKENGGRVLVLNWASYRGRK